MRVPGTGSDWRPGREESGPWRWKALFDIHAVPSFYIRFEGGAHGWEVSDGVGRRAGVFGG